MPGSLSLRAVIVAESHAVINVKGGKYENTERLQKMGRPQEKCPLANSACFVRENLPFFSLPTVIEGPQESPKEDLGCLISSKLILSSRVICIANLIYAFKIGRSRLWVAV